MSPPIKPAPGYAFVIEDAEDFSNLEGMGLEMPEDAKKGVGSTGTVLSATYEQQGLFPWIRHWLLADRILKRYKEGDRIIYDKFIASDIYFRDKKGVEVKRLKSVPIDCILGVLCE